MPLELIGAVENILKQVEERTGKDNVIRMTVRRWE